SHSCQQAEHTEARTFSFTAGGKGTRFGGGGSPGCPQRAQVKSATSGRGPNPYYRPRSRPAPAPTSSHTAVTPFHNRGSRAMVILAEANIAGARATSPSHRRRPPRHQAGGGAAPAEARPEPAALLDPRHPAGSPRSLPAGPGRAPAHRRAHGLAHGGRPRPAGAHPHGGVDGGPPPAAPRLDPRRRIGREARAAHRGRGATGGRGGLQRGGEGHAAAAAAARDVEHREPGVQDEGQGRGPAATRRRSVIS